MVDSADLLLHPVRLRVMLAFLGERALTSPQPVAELSDTPAARLCRHVAHLMNAGVLQVAAERRLRGTAERTYVPRLAAASIGPDEVASLNADDHRQGFMAFVAGWLADRDRYLRPGFDPLRDQVGYRPAGVWLDDAKLLSDLTALRLRLVIARRRGCRRRILATVLVLGDDALADERPQSS
jgi:hypothetical protein